MMKPLPNYEEHKAVLVEDMLSSISYTPNREQDILAFMEQYQKASVKHRPQILANLRSCMDGHAYPNPYAERYRYTQETVAKVSSILDDYNEGITAVAGDSKAIAECVQETIGQLNALNDSSCGALIDSWRRERLCAFLNIAVENSGMTCSDDRTYQHGMW